MPLHPDFPASPYAILDPEVRWFPADKAPHKLSHSKLLPPLVHTLRKKVKIWRESGYVGATATSVSLLNWWFKHKHIIPNSDGKTEVFQYYFAQREALETVIYLYDVVKARSKYDLMRFDASGNVSANMFDESWLRLVIKMATGTGKTKVMSLILAWCYFHKQYEKTSELARNFLLITPNIIVLDRIRADFDGLRIFFRDPVLPDNGYAGNNWKDDFQLTLHIQDAVHITRKTGNIFLTNIHRVYSSNSSEPSADDENTMDYFLGRNPVGKTTDSKVDLGDIVRDIDELVVLNDEAHHIHDSRLAWFKSIEDIHHRLQHKSQSLSLQIDTTATPKHDNGAIFVQTVSDYPLVEAISQNIVKHPVIPDAASRAKLEVRENCSSDPEKYADYLNLGIEEWRKTYAKNIKLRKKSILFVMTDNTKSCDDVATYIEKLCPELKNAVLTIHTKKNGEVAEASSKDKKDLEKLRKQSNEIDSLESNFKAIVSVLVLKEGWDVKNVTTIVGLRAYASKSNILPEQTLGRGVRKMYPGNIEEYISIVGTDAFIEFVEGIQSEGVDLEHKAMGEGTEPKTPLIVEVDNNNPNKDLEILDIEIPCLSRRYNRNYNKLAELDEANFDHEKVIYQHLSKEKQREIVFRDISSGELNHTTWLDSSVALDSSIAEDYRAVIGYFTRNIIWHLHLVSGYDVLYSKVQSFIKDHLFTTSVVLDNSNTLCNLSEPQARKTLVETFEKQINILIVQDKGGAEIKGTIKLRETHPFPVTGQAHIMEPKKSIFNKIIGDSSLEIEFAAFLDKCEDVVSFAKNYLAVSFFLDYVKADGNISKYYPDFIVKCSESQVFIVETKGLEDLDVPHKMKRLHEWCVDVNKAQSSVVYKFVFVGEDPFYKYRPKNFQSLVAGFKKYQQELSNK